MLPRSFWRGDYPSFKDLQDLCVGKVKIAPSAREMKRRRKGAAPLVNEGEKERFKPTPTVNILNIYRPEHPDNSSEYPVHPKYPDICPEYPAPLGTEQKQHEGS
jgi:hypothetical protein